MSRSDYTIICANGHFEIRLRTNGKLIHHDKGGNQTAEEWLKEYLRK